MMGYLDCLHPLFGQQAAAEPSWLAVKLHHLDTVLFAVLPYVALATFFLVTIQRYRTQRFSYSSLSSQFLENQEHFWGLVPFHYGILVVLAGHVVAFLIPREILAWNSHPLRLYVLEVTALVFGLLTLVGLVACIVRRLTNPKVCVVTTPSDWVLYALLAFQVASGVHVAIAYLWGSSWFAASLSPYLWSIVQLNPDVSYVVELPWLVKLHIVNASLLIAFFPFTRLVHILVVPNPYLWRKTQVVRWYHRPGTAGR
jgi:nitrate reductase gamma subunit